MAVATADFCKALNAAWDASGLDAKFKALWPAAVLPGEFPVLHDQEAAPGQPFPYAVLDVMDVGVTARMSDGALTKRELREVTVAFTVQAREVTGDARDAKGIAADMVAEVMKVFGGHPTVPPTAVLTLDNGDVVQLQYQTDFGVRTSDDSYSWVMKLKALLDVPMTT